MKKALIVYGGWDGHDPEGVAHVFREILTGEDFEVTMSDTLEAFRADLTGYDLIVPVWTMGTLDEEAERNVCDAVAKGTGIAGCHGGMCDAFRNSTLWQFMTGAQWVAHPGNDSVTYTVELLRETGDPIVEGMADFSLKSEQYYIHVDPAVKVLAVTRFPTADGPHSANGEVHIPVVYTKRWGSGRVFYNSLGHNREIFRIPQARELMRRGFLFAAR